MFEKARRAWTRLEEVFGRDAVLGYAAAALVFFPLNTAFGAWVGYGYGLLWILSLLLARYLMRTRKDGTA
jgi:hypothetical protein